MEENTFVGWITGASTVVASTVIILAMTGVIEAAGSPFAQGVGFTIGALACLALNILVFTEF